MMRCRAIFVTVTITSLLVSQNFGYQLPNGGKIWALLAAGSFGYENYRHQADICHAYQILHSNGIPDENIIVMMHDDVAYSSTNPDKGVIINQPGGPNVYKGVLKDYTGQNLTAGNFLNILKGNEEAMKNIGSGRVIKSGPNDHVFVNFVDHGAPGLVVFGDGELYASDLIKTLKEMEKEEKFAKLVLYVEACESGSMFDAILPNDLNILALTAADPNESSYACYYDEHLGVYLGDVFSVNWMQDTEKENLLREKINYQFEIVRTETNTSHVEEYGDLDLGSLPVSQFMGFRTTKNGFSSGSLPPIEDAVPSRDVPLASLENKREQSKDQKEKDHYSFKIHTMLKYRRHLDQVVDDILMLITGNNEAKVEELKNDRYTLQLNDYPCYKKLISAFQKKCFKLSENPYALNHMHLFANICGRSDIDENKVITAMKKICTSRHLLKGVK